jgi:hypothetical protein
VTVIALVTGLVAIGPGSAAGGTGGPSADIAKKCKKKKGKKRKCKKKKAPVTPPPLLTSKVRATLTWNSTADLDLHIWSPTGGHNGYNPGTNGYDAGILNSIGPSDDTNGFGPETFTDGQWYEPPPASTSPLANRQFSFTVCQNSNTATLATLVYVDRTGLSQTRQFVLNNAGTGVSITVTPGGLTPPNPWCSL